MSGEIVLLLGPPAGGKTSLAQPYVDRGYARVNRDTMGPSARTADLAPTVEHLVEQGQRTFVLDNLFLTRERRAAVLAVGQKYNIPVVARVLDTRPEQAQFNAARRMIQRYGSLISASEKKDHPQAKDDDNVFPPVVLSNYFKVFEHPTVDEGFAEVQSVHFNFQLGPEYINRAVIFDLDGTLRVCKSGAKYPTDPDDVALAFPGIPEKLWQLRERGYLLLAATNQSGVAKGALTVMQMNDCITRTYALVGHDLHAVACTHPSGPPSCWCQKPMPGMGVALIERYRLNPRECLYIGDMTKDKTFAGRCGFGFAFAEDYFK